MRIAVIGRGNVGGGLAARWRRAEHDVRVVALKRVYLAGPPYAEEYRRRAAALLAQSGLEPVHPMLRDFRGRTEGREAEIVEGDLADIDSCEAVLPSFTAPDEGTATEAWYAHTQGIPVVAYTGETPVHPWTVYLSAAVCAELEEAIRALRP